MSSEPTRTPTLEQPNLRVAEAKRWIADLEDNSVSLLISSPPYSIGKEYDESASVEEFLPQLHEMFCEIDRVLKPGGSVCWQVGYHVKNNVVVPLDFLVHSVFGQDPFRLRNRIVWQFGHGAHCEKRLSGRHETVLWYTKGDNYRFDLDTIRIPQKYPGKRHYKGPNKGELSGSPAGKNPGDVWDIPNVKAGHVEKTDHPCQFPVALAGRLVAALSLEKDLVVDPFMGSGTTAIAAMVLGRRFSGCDREARYVDIARTRVKSVLDGTARVRPDYPVFVPVGNEAVATRPEHFVSGSWLMEMMSRVETDCVV